MSNQWKNADAALSQSRPQGVYGTNIADSDSNSHSAFSVGTNGSSKIDQLATFFGKPSRPISNQTDYYEQEYDDYPAAFTKAYGTGGSTETYLPNAYISRVLIEKVMASMNWPLTIMAPWFHHKDGGLVFQWDTTIYNQHMLDREPEESTPRMLTSNRSSGSATMVRYGIALMLESNFAGTEVGRQTYLANLEQIRIATVETCSHGVVVSILEHTPYTNSIQRAYANEQRDKVALDRLFKEETSMFGIVHKELNGYDKIRSRLSTEMSRRIGGCEGNFTVIPMGMGSYIHGTRDGKYYLDGRSSDRDNIKLNANGQTVVESRSFSNGEHNVPHDPCFRQRTIGGFQVLDDSHLRERNVLSYTTNQMDFQGYDESSDDWFSFRYSQLYDKAGVWNFNERAAPLTDRIGRGWASDTACYTYGSLYRRNANIHRAIDKIYALSYEKQIEFLASLRLLPEDDDRADAKHDFDMNEFDRMINNDLTWDVTFTVPQRRDFKRKQMDAIGIDSNEDYFKFESQQKASRPVHSYAVARKVSDEDAVVNLTTQIAASFGITHKNGTGDVSTKEAIDYYISKIKLVDVYNGTLATVVSVPTFQCSQIAERGTPREVVCRYLHSILNQSMAPDATKILLLSEFRRIALGSATIRFSTENNGKVATAQDILAYSIEPYDPAILNKNGLFHDLVAASFAPFALRFDTDIALLQIPPTLLTRNEKMHRNGEQSTDLSDVTDFTGQWDPEISGGPNAVAELENGRISVFVESYRVPTDVCKTESVLPIVHDVYAATLSANHAVLYAIDEPADCKRLTEMSFAFSGSLSRLRTDALTASVVLSLIHMGVISCIHPVDSHAAAAKPEQVRDMFKEYQSELKNQAITTIPPKVLVRLRRWLSQPKASHKPLMCQIHLAASIDMAMIILGIIVESGSYFHSVEAFKKTLNVCNKKSQYLRYLAHRDRQGRTQVEVDLLARNFDKALHGVYVAPLTAAVPAAAVGAAGSVAPSGSAAPSGAGMIPTSPKIAGLWNKTSIRDLLDRSSLVSGELFRFCVENDIPVALSLTTWRPSKTYNMGTMIRMQTGENGAAKTFYKNPDFMMADNAAQKMIYGHFTLYSKTIVFHPEKIILGHNVFCESYVGGNGVAVWDPLNEDHLLAYRDNSLICDMFVTYGVMKDAGASSTRTSWKSMTGVMPKSLGATSSVNELVYYPGCAAVSDYWGWKTDARDYYTDIYRANSQTDTSERKFNVICMQEVQLRRDSHTHAYTTVVRDAGHWGDKVYPGCAAVRNGQKSIFDTPNYHDTKVITLN